MAISQALVSISTDTFNDWITKTNQIAANLSTQIVTANSATGVTVGNAYVNGIFSANTFAVTQSLRGGTVASSGTLNISTPFASNGVVLYVGGFASFSTATANQIVDQYSISTYRSAKYVLQVNSASGYQATEILVMHDGTNAYITEYATLTTAGTIATFSANISAGSLNLLISPVPTVSTVSFERTSIAV
jgi:hypothetical protein